MGSQDKLLQVDTELKQTTQAVAKDGLASDKPVVFESDKWVGRVSRAFKPIDIDSAVEKVIDPGEASQTIHWGRNYLYSTTWESSSGPLDVIVKQFRNQGLRRRLDRRFRGSKAERSWHASHAILAAGLRTPQPVALIESRCADGPSFFVCERLPASDEVRHFFRRRNGDTEAGEFPDVAPEEVLEALGSLARDLHDQGIWYRDLSMGNILAEQQEEDGELLFHLVDTNRARIVPHLSLWRRCRDISRLPVLRREDREIFLKSYWSEVPSRFSLRWMLFVGSMESYLFKHAVKNRLRRRKRVRGGKHGGAHHPHIPAAEDGASSRDKMVWDRLSDQPHQHAGRMEKLAIRAADLPSHLYDLALLASAFPSAWKRFRQLQEERRSWRAALDGIGLCVRPFVQDPDSQLAAIEDLGVRKLLLRLHPWEQDHTNELRFAQELSDRGCELVFALPQNRALVRDRSRWRAAVTEISELFTPYGSCFQVGQAPNRSKWGTWTRKEYIELYAEAAEILRNRPGVEVIGPAVIDFEPHATLALVNRRYPGLRFDVVSSLLYVDRRGAPENKQVGFDTADKALFLSAIAETGASGSDRSWVTEVNWPLWEGPHSPAGKTVSVTEDAQANYLPRYYLLSLCSGGIERVYWWRLVARGYGLISAGNDGKLRRRASFSALQTLIQQTAGAVCVGSVTQCDSVWKCHLDRRGDEIIAAWTCDGRQEFELPREAIEIVERDGTTCTPSMGRLATASPSIRYFKLAK
ncbi:MAG: hypothetical protein GY906_16745 [bacterium]|nr:hypothetical protein [bacterium]